MANVDVLSKDTWLARAESFGATVLHRASGRRSYLTREEFRILTVENRMPLDVKPGVAPVDRLVVRRPQLLPSGNFSAPDTVFFEVTGGCNLTCSHCFNSSGGETSPRQLSQKQFEMIVSNLAECGVQEIRFTGGEPLLFPGIFNLIHLAASLGLRTSVGTNATLIGKKDAGALANAGLNAAIVSIDGLEKRHDAIRGKGSFRAAMDGLEQLRAEHIDVRVNMVIMRSNVPDIETLVDYFFHRRISVFIRRFILSGRAGGATVEMLSEREYVDVRERLSNYLADKGGLIDGHYLRERRIQTRIKLPFHRKECSAGHRGLVILPDGKVQTCGFLGPLGEPSVGSVPVERFSGIWSRLVSSRHMTDLEASLASYNQQTAGPKTNCLAVVMADREFLLSQSPRRSWS